MREQTLNSMETCSISQLAEQQAMLKAIKRLQEELEGDVKVGKQTENRLKAERKNVVTVNGKKQIR